MNRTPHKAYGSSPLVRCVVACGAVLFSIGAFFVAREQGFTLISFALQVCAFLSFAALWDLYQAKIEINDIELVVHHNFKTRTYRKHQISNVQYESGSVFLTDVEGHVFSLPDIGCDMRAVYNSVRAWNKHD